MGYKHYTGAEINAIKGVIKECRSKGMSNAQTAEHMTKLGMTTSSGMAWNDRLVSSFIANNPIRGLARQYGNAHGTFPAEKSAARKVLKTATAPNMKRVNDRVRSDRIDLATLVLSSNLPREDQDKMLATLFGAK